MLDESRKVEKMMAIEPFNDASRIAYQDFSVLG
jgi:hypothetical protein